jgi:hypothetical protein
MGKTTYPEEERRQDLRSAWYFVARSRPVTEAAVIYFFVRV